MNPQTDHQPDGESPQGDTIHANVGEGAQNVAIGKQIVQYISTVLQIPQWLTVAILAGLVLLTGVAATNAYFNRQDARGDDKVVAAIQATSTATPTPTATPLPVATAAPDEMLILIAAFHVTTDDNTEPHVKIRRAIEEKIDELEISDLRAENEPTMLTADDRAVAEALGQRYNASMIIWGEDTGVEVIVNFLNLRQPDFDAAEARIVERERVQLASNPDPYVHFITTDLPGQLTFFSLFAVGQSYYSVAEYAQALDTIQAAVDGLADDARPDGLADAYFRLGWLQQVPFADVDSALLNYNQAVALNPEYVDAYNNRGAAHADRGDLAAALLDYDRAIALNPEFAAAYNNRGLMHHELGDLAAALADYNQGLSLNPEIVEAYNNRGNAHYDNGNLTAALADYDRAITLNAGYALAYYNRATVHAMTGALTAALTDYDRAIVLDPEYVEAYNNRGIVHADAGDMAAALTDYDQAIALDPLFAEAYYNRANAHHDNGNLTAALTDYDRAIALNPEYSAAYFNRGNTHAATGNLTAALEDYDRAIALDPAYIAAYVNRGAAHTTIGDLAAALADYDQVLALDPEIAEAYWGRGVVHGDQGNLAAALADFRRYLELRPDAENRAIFEEWIAELEMEIGAE